MKAYEEYAARIQKMSHMDELEALIEEASNDDSITNDEYCKLYDACQDRINEVTYEAYEWEDDYEEEARGGIDYEEGKMMKVKVIGRKYDTSKVLYYDWDKEHKYPHFSSESEDTVFEIEAESVTAASLWLIDNHPELFAGSNVIAENGDFAMHCVPDYYVSIYGLDRVQKDLVGIIRAERPAIERW